MILETRMTTTTYEVTRKIYILALGLRDDLSVTARGIFKTATKALQFLNAYKIYSPQVIQTCINFSTEATFSVKLL